MELKDLASEHRAAILAVMHLNKENNGKTKALYRVQESITFTVLARAVYAVTKDHEDGERRLMVCLKHNLSPDKTGVAYRLKLAGNGLPFVDWEDELVTLTPDEAFSPDDDEERSLVDDAAEWLFVI